MPMKAVCLLNQRLDGKILAVSRKNDWSQFGLPGGKVEFGESDDDALRREVKEETGLSCYGLEVLFTNPCEGEVRYETRTYFAARTEGLLHTDEPIDIAWVTPEILLAGPFGAYMKVVFDTLGITDKTSRCSYCALFKEGVVADKWLRNYPTICQTCLNQCSSIEIRDA